MNRIFHMEFRLLKSCGYHLGCCFLDHVSQRKLVLLSRGSTTERPRGQGLSLGNNHISELGNRDSSPPHLSWNFRWHCGQKWHLTVSSGVTLRPRNWNQPHPDSCTVVNYEITNICCFKPLSFGIIYGATINKYYKTKDAKVFSSTKLQLCFLPLVLCDKILTHLLVTIIFLNLYYRYVSFSPVCL